MSYFTQFSPGYQGSQGEVNDLPSVTVPDMNISIQRLLENHTRGYDSDVVERIPNYSETEIPRFEDMTDRLAFKEDLEARREALKEEIRAERSSKVSKDTEPEKQPLEGSERPSEKKEDSGSSENSTIHT